MKIYKMEWKREYHVTVFRVVRARDSILMADMGRGSTMGWWERGKL
jgi:hypothetical protein